MNVPESVSRYFDAWNSRDADAIVAAFAPDGSYTDPTTGGPLVGAQIGDYAHSLWSAFPDLSFELRNAASIGAGRTLVEWTMHGVNDGPLADLPPTGLRVSVPGVDVIESGPDGIGSVTGYFDSRTVPEQLGLEVLVQPEQVGPFSFGDAVAVQSGSAAKPGAFSITSIWNDAADAGEIRAAARATATEMLSMEGFIGLILVRIGRRGITVAAWERPEHVKQMGQSPSHREAMQQFWSELGDAAFTSVWTPDHINPLWVRCSECGKMADYEKGRGHCGCGAALADPPSFF